MDNCGHWTLMKTFFCLELGFIKDLKNSSTWKKNLLFWPFLLTVNIYAGHWILYNDVYNTLQFSKHFASRKFYDTLKDPMREAGQLSYPHSDEKTGSWKDGNMQLVTKHVPSLSGLSVYFYLVLLADFLSSEAWIKHLLFSEAFCFPLLKHSWNCSSV